MNIRVELSVRAMKDLKKLTTRDMARVSRSIDYLGKNPFFGRKMEGEFNGLWRIKVAPFRVVYKYDKSSGLVVIVTIGYREGIYKRLGL